MADMKMDVGLYSWRHGDLQIFPSLSPYLSHCSSHYQKLDLQSFLVRCDRHVRVLCDEHSDS
jgi:hypothetical protein